MAAAATEHLRDSELHPVHDTYEVHVDLLTDDPLFGVEERAEMHHARIVHEDVNRPIRSATRGAFTC